MTSKCWLCVVYRALAYFNKQRDLGDLVGAVGGTDLADP
jgi:hypothetical protein